MVVATGRVVAVPESAVLAHPSANPNRSVIHNRNIIAERVEENLRPLMSPTAFIF